MRIITRSRPRRGLSLAAFAFLLLDACGGKVLWVPDGDGGAGTTGSNAKVSSSNTSTQVSTSAGFGGAPDGSAAVGVGGGGPACGGDQMCTVSGSQCSCSGTCWGNKISAVCSTAADPQCDCYVNGMVVGGCFGGVAGSCDLLSGCCGQFFYMTTAPPNPP